MAYFLGPPRISVYYSFASDRAINCYSNTKDRGIYNDIPYTKTEVILWPEVEPGGKMSCK